LTRILEKNFIDSKSKQVREMKKKETSYLEVSGTVTELLTEECSLEPFP